MSEEIVVETAFDTIEKNDEEFTVKSLMFNRLIFLLLGILIVGIPSLIKLGLKRRKKNDGGNDHY